MNFGFPTKVPGFGANPNNGLDRAVETVGVLSKSTKERSFFDVKLWGWSILSIIPWAISARDKIWKPSTLDKELKRPSGRYSAVKSSRRPSPVRFRPYVGKVPWHTGARAFLSQLFPRYGHYCGPNWSSGKDGGSLLWDKRPIDWVDFCCYCHDIGYDTHDQASLLKADLAFLECLERPHMSTKGDAHVAQLYKTMCITGMLSRSHFFCGIVYLHNNNYREQEILMVIRSFVSFFFDGSFAYVEYLLCFVIYCVIFL